MLNGDRLVARNETLEVKVEEYWGKILWFRKMWNRIGMFICTKQSQRVIYSTHYLHRMSNPIHPQRSYSILTIPYVGDGSYGFYGSKARLLPTGLLEPWSQEHDSI